MTQVNLRWDKTLNHIHIANPLDGPLKIDKYNSTPKASERSGLIVMCFISSAAVAEMCLRLRFIHAGLISSLPQSVD